MQKSIAVFLVAAFAGLSHSQLLASVIPPNLPAGAQYQLVFVTAGVRDATSSDPADYNAFVTAQAALNPLLPSDVTWHAVAVTPALNAADNAPSGGLPVYNSQGIQVAASATGLYAFNLLSPIRDDQFGNVGNAAVWTGMGDTGGLLIAFPLGTGNSIPAFDYPVSVWGHSAATDEGWADAGFAPLTSSYSLYALSTAITVVPEPSSLVLAALSLVVLAAWGWRRKR